MQGMRLGAALVALMGVGCGGADAPRVARPMSAEAPQEIEAATEVEARALPTTPPDLTVGEDVLALVAGWNEETKRPPPSVFRRIATHALGEGGGHRGRRGGGANPPRLERFEGGFRVQLPSHAPIVTPTVYRDLVLVSGGFRSREMYAFHARTGETAWAIGLGDDGPSSAACDDGVCVFNTESCTLFSVDARTGELLWSWYTGDPLMAAPAVADGLVYASYPIRGGGTWPAGEDRPLPEGVSHALAAFELRTGELRWTRWIDAEVISAPLAYAGRVYAATFGGTLLALDGASGEIVQARRAMATAAPTIIDGALYFSRREDEGGESFERIVRSDALAASERRASPSGKPGDPPARVSTRRRAAYLRSEFQDGTSFAAESLANDAANGFGAGAPAAANAQVARALVGRQTVHALQEFQGSWVLGLGDTNLVTMGEAVVAYDRQSGRERWAVSLPGDLARAGGALGAPPAAAGEHLVVPTLSGQILVLDRQGNVARRLEANAPLRTQAVVDGGWIYVGTANGQLVALDTGDASLTGWPTWAGDAARTGRPSR
ncbi:MAG: PQQ-binding-like beta-propeller repeat protein [Myxococcales bacterium]|nr:PQQ-binding-like beta-propeller repeat protein [Myxococcales bacterium]